MRGTRLEDRASQFDPNLHVDMVWQKAKGLFRVCFRQMIVQAARFKRKLHVVFKINCMYVD